MPELPEVETTVKGLNKKVKGKKILSIETSYRSLYHAGKDNIKDPKFFTFFKKRVKGKKILGATRRAKNVLIHLSSGDTILTHMKMTGHFVYDKPLTKFIRLNFKLDNGKYLSFSDMRKFAKVTLIKTTELENSIHLKHLGLEPLDKNFQFPQFKAQILKRPKGKIKQVLLDQSLISGIGNIYSDEILWRSGVHPLSSPDKIPERSLRAMFVALKESLRKGIDFGGDSTSDYRNIEGGRGKFQDYHRAYQKHKALCDKRGCSGILEKIKVGGRTAHFCPVHQKLYK